MRRLLTALALGLVAAAPLQAEDFPSRTIKLVVPFGPGGPTDVAARLVTQIVQTDLGATIVVENRPGAGGATGSKSVANAEPDGYTLLVGTSATLAVVPALMKSPGYDPVKSFAAVAKVADSTTVMIVPANFPANSVQEFVAYARAHPGALSYASAGAGNQTQLVAELLKAKAGITAIHVPYKSGAEMVTAVLSEQVQLSFPDISILLPLIRAHKVKALAVTSAKRHPQLPDVPTLAESGFPDFAVTFWSGVVAPAGTPAAIVDKLNAAIAAGLRSPEIQEKLAAIGAQTAPGSPQDFARFIADETVKWRAIAATARVSLD
ncbi:MAG TPA: tripartite tricarboxylate transporter substrate binding protein [Xanthobacteraceae bacterium]|nr:tripartite tricarboxylate transporter substrate binding protein [Xanthobacteraceae bacterium]